MKWARSLAILWMLVVCGAANSGAQVDLEEELCGFWSFDGDAEEWLQDSSSNGRHAAVVFGDPQQVPGRTGKAMLFSGSDGLEIPDYYGVTGDAARTVTLWIRTNAEYPTLETGLIGWGLTQPGAKLHFKIESSKKGIRSEYSTAAAVGETPLNDGEWHHVALVLPGPGSTVADVRHFVDGTLETSAYGQSIPDLKIDTETDPKLGAKPVTIGFVHSTSSPRFAENTEIDEVGIWQRALSDEEVAVLASGARPFGNTPARATNSGAGQENVDQSSSFPWLPIVLVLVIVIAAANFVRAMKKS